MASTSKSTSRRPGNPPQPPPSSRPQPQVDPFIPKTDHNPRELKSWAKRTGFKSTFSSGESLAAPPPPPPESRSPAPPLDLEKGLSPGGRRRRRRLEIGALLGRREREREGDDDVAGEVGGDGDEELGFGGGGGDVVERRRRRRREKNGDVGMRSWKEEEEEDEEERRVEEELVEMARKGKSDNDVVTNGRSSNKNNNNNNNIYNDHINSNIKGNGVAAKGAAMSMGMDREKKEEEQQRGQQVEVGLFADEFSGPELMEGGGGDGDGGGGGNWQKPLGLKCGITENPGWGLLILYGIQQYLSIAGSLVFIPLIMVPTMGGSDKDTATVISTMLLVSGVTTILHTLFGTRLPLIQGSSFVYLAPALVIANSEEFRNLSDNKFKHIMRELQGAIIIGSVFQALLGYSGLMSLLLRLINPVVVAPTVAAVGLAYFSYGFPQAGNCVEISMPLIVLVLIFTLYMRKISLFGNRIFVIYAVPLGVMVIWAYAFFLTAGGAYNYKGCSSNIPSSNILLDSCRRRLQTMQYCRTDVSNAWRTSAWVRVPYPFQWGLPTFNFKTAIIMMIVSLVASVDSLASYHATSLLVNLRPPTPGVVSRGIGLEGLSSILAGLWGTGTGSTTLTENLHTLDATKVASRRALQLGAALLIFFSFFGKVGAILASIPLALAASVLCFTWALIVALGLSTLRYTQTASSRNIIIVGFTLFISLSIPAYFQQYEPSSSLILPSYLLPYAAASSGPVHSGSSGLNYALNALLSINMVVALLVAFILDNTVPGSKQERGVYIWSDPNRPDVDPASLEPYRLPEKIRSWFKWAKCIGL